MPLDKVETCIELINFYDNMPIAETVTKVYDHLDFPRGVDVMSFLILAQPIP